jgi:hypothetical protein
MGVARLVRARHFAPRMSTTPSGETLVMASPSSPIIHSRPMVGVEKRVRTMAGMPPIMASEVPPMPDEQRDPRQTEPVVEQERAHDQRSHPDARPHPGTPVCTSTEKPNMASTIRARATGRTGQDRQAVGRQHERASAHQAGHADAGGEELEDDERQPHQQQQVGHCRAGHRVEELVLHRERREDRGGDRFAHGAAVLLHLSRSRTLAGR